MPKIHRGRLNSCICLLVHAAPSSGSSAMHCTIRGFRLCALSAMCLGDVGIASSIFSMAPNVTEPRGHPSTAHPNPPEQRQEQRERKKEATAARGIFNIYFQQQSCFPELETSRAESCASPSSLHFTGALCFVPSPGTWPGDTRPEPRDRGRAGAELLAAGRCRTGTPGNGGRALLRHAALCSVLCPWASTECCLPCSSASPAARGLLQFLGSSLPMGMLLPNVGLGGGGRQPAERAAAQPLSNVMQSYFKILSCCPLTKMCFGVELIICVAGTRGLVNLSQGDGERWSRAGTTAGFGAAAASRGPARDWAQTKGTGKGQVPEPKCQLGPTGGEHEPLVSAPCHCPAALLVTHSPLCTPAFLKLMQMFANC